MNPANPETLSELLKTLERSGELRSLARECGLTNLEINPAIEAMSRFFSYYCDRGAVPYGEHEAFWQGHENNGKSGLAAVSFMLQPGRVDEGNFFAKM